MVFSVFAGVRDRGHNVHVWQGRLNRKDAFTRSERFCKYCALWFPNMQSLLEHYSLVGNHGFAVICQLCGKGFKTITGQQQHQRMEHEAGKDCPRCEICNKVFSAKSVLMVHKKVHSNSRPWKCPLCGSEFKHKHVMLRHEKTCKSKTEGMWYLCEVYTI